MSDLSYLKLEDLREELIKKGDIKKFINTYKIKIDNSNSSKVWDKKFNKPQTLNAQDKMTKDKISFIVKSLKNKKQPFELLDIGIGQGYLEQSLIKRSTKFHLYAVDISDLSIIRAKKNFQAKAIKSDALNIEKHYRPKSFDVIVAIEVIEHISPNKIFSFYKKVYKLLKDEGTFIISTPLNEGLRYMKINTNAHVREYTPNILRKEFELSNLKIVETKTFIAFKNFYFLKKIISWLVPHRWKPNNIVIIAKKA